MYGIVQTLEAVTQQARFSCPTGNCFYPDLPSLSVCSACHDFTPTLELVQVPDSSRLKITLVSPNAAAAHNWNIARYRLLLPSILGLDNSVSLTMSGTANLSQSASFSADRCAAAGLMWAQTILRHRRSDDPSLLGSNETDTVEATECMLYHCVKTYSSAVSNGTLHKRSVDLGASRVPSSWSLVPDRNAESAASLTPQRERTIAFSSAVQLPPPN